MSSTPSASRAATARRLVIIGLISTLADAAWAQTVVQLRTDILYGSGTGCGSSACPTLISYDPDAGQVLRQVAVAPGHGAYTTPDGAVLAWLSSSRDGLVLHALSNAVEVTVPLGAVSTGFVGSPARAELYLDDLSGGYALSTAGARRLATPPCAGPVSAVSISADGSRVAYSCTGGAPYTAVLDTVSGALLRTLPWGWSPILSPDGTALIQGEPTSIVDTSIRRRLVSSGAIAGEYVLPPNSPGPSSLSVEPSTGRIFAKTASFSGVLDGTTLAATNSPAVGCFGPGPVDWKFDRGHARAFAVSAEPVPAIGTVHNWFCQLDTATLTPTFTTVWASTYAVDSAGLGLAYAPRAPIGFAAAVQGSAVTMTWAPGSTPAEVVSYSVEAGTAPGLADITTVNAGAQTTLGVSGVPPGTYYVRVRALNYMGVSSPSAEVTVVVP